MLYAIIGMLVIILDQGVKYWVTNNIMLDVVTEPLIPGILSLVRIHNDGAAFSFLAGGGARIYFIILTGIFTLAVIIALATNFISGRFSRWCLVLVTAGGLSNCLDRVLYGFVVDMFKVDLFNFAVFNVADIFITVFALLFIVAMIFGGGGEKSHHPDEFDEEDDEDEDRPDMRGALREGMSDRRAARTEKAMRAAETRAADKRSERRAAKYEYEDEEEESRGGLFGRKKNRDEAPARDRRAERELAREEKAASRRGRKTLYEEDYEQFQAQRREAQPQRAQSRGPAAEGNDPFAAWEKANARYETSQSSNATAKAMGVSRPSAPKAPARGAQTGASRREAAAADAATKTAPKRPTGIDLETDFPMRSPQRAQRAQRAETAPVAERPARRAAEEELFDIAQQHSVEKPAPAAPKAPAAPAPKPAPALEEEFSLDDILAEFK